MCRKWAATRFQQNDNVTVTPPGKHRVLHGWFCCISVILFVLISDILPLKVCFSSCTFPEFVIRCIRSEINKNQEETEWHCRSLCDNSEFSLCINITVHFWSSNTLRQKLVHPRTQAKQRSVPCEECSDHKRNNTPQTHGTTRKPPHKDKTQLSTFS